jgi:DNA-3-methyladenine glycosylase I
MIKRCNWAGTDPLMIAYHDNEWGQPLHDDRRLFEFLILEGAQAGLSWMTILKKRENFRRALNGFDPNRVAGYGDEKIRLLLQDKGIIRNRLKIGAAVANATAFLDVQAAFGSFDTYIWQFVNHKPVINRWKNLADIPAKTPASEAMSKDLKQRGFRFVGPTICYAFMQAIGMVNDHTIDCFRHAEINQGPYPDLL